MTWAKDRDAYKAYIQTPTGQVKHLGYFDNVADASAARKAAELRYWPKPKRVNPREVTLANCWNPKARSV